jgi:hypothetical protein
MVKGDPLFGTRPGNSIRQFPGLSGTVFPAAHQISSLEPFLDKYESRFLCIDLYQVFKLIEVKFRSKQNPMPLTGFLIHIAFIRLFLFNIGLPGWPGGKKGLKSLFKRLKPARETT